MQSWTCPKTQKVIGITGERAFQTVAAEKASNTTIVTYISTGGMVTKPMVILKAAKVHTDWRDAAPSGYFMRASASGYINADLFFKYGKKLVSFLERETSTTFREENNDTARPAQVPTSLITSSCN